MVKQYCGMKRCKFCKHHHIYQYNKSGKVLACSKYYWFINPNSWCGEFVSGGILPEVAVDNEVMR